jgi:hypothetical protein
MERRIIEASIRRRVPLPDIIENAPEILLGLEVYYEAFLELDTCRTVGMSAGRIPWTAIDRYAERHGFTGDGFDYLLHMIRAMDDAFLKYSRDKAAKDKPPEPTADGQ